MSLRQSLWLALGVAACRGDAETTAPPITEGCGYGAVVLEDGRCLPAGRQPNGCEAGELALDDGTCQAAGVPPSGCGNGFLSDDNGGCVAVHPSAPCPAGSVALLGERACHAIVECGVPPWGDIPVRAGTVYVDANSSAIVPDGSEANPWLTIQQAINAAPRDAMIAIAAGSYAEDLVIEGKPVALWGRCPELVDIRGSTATFTTLLVESASGTEIHSVGVTGPRIGVLVTGAEDVIIDGTWIHHTGGRGLDIENVQGPTSARVTRTLIESAQEFGFMVLGSDVEVEFSEVRSSNDLGIAVEDYNGRSRFKLVSSVVAENREIGAYIGGSDGIVEASWVHDTKPSAELAFGWGLALEQGPVSGELANISVKSVVAERNGELGVYLAGGAFDIEHVVVRDTVPSVRDGTAGWGMELGLGYQDGPTTAAIRSSTVERCHDQGIVVLDSKADFAGLLVRDISTRAADGRYGVGIGSNLGQMTVQGSLIERAHMVGFLLTAGEATLEGVAIRDMLPQKNEIGGMGIASGPDPKTVQASNIVVRWSRIERCLGFGMLLRDPSALVEGTAVTDTKSGADGLFGDNVAVISHYGPAAAAFSGMLISGSERAGIANFGANVSIERTRLDCNSIDLDGEVYAERAFAFEAATDNDCGCHGVAHDCKVLSTSLTPPDPLDR